NHLLGRQTHRQVGSIGIPKRGTTFLPVDSGRAGASFPKPDRSERRPQSGIAFNHNHQGTQTRDNTKRLLLGYNIDGVSFSHLVTNHCVTRGRFAKLLAGLGVIHAATRLSNGTAEKVDDSNRTSEYPGGDSGSGRNVALAPRAVAPACEPIQQAVVTERSPRGRSPSIMCANLHQKASQLLESNETAYLGFDGIDVRRMSKTILSYLSEYQESASYRGADFVHGDPVFSNCLLNKANDPVFIDMRGALGDTVCTEGDVNYDLSKVYQSLNGYDFIILDKELDQTAIDMLCDLEENVFWPFVREHYEDVLPQDIAVMAASHFLSIVPLHENRHHQARFLEACKNILSRQGPLLG
ncbi:unnamed protein product, partial [Laminaria digitata]